MYVYMCVCVCVCMCMCVCVCLCMYGRVRLCVFEVVCSNTLCPCIRALFCVRLLCVCGGAVIATIYLVRVCVRHAVWLLKVLSQFPRERDFVLNKHR